jgi:hypothetical protein
MHMPAVSQYAHANSITICTCQQYHNMHASNKKYARKQYHNVPASSITICTTASLRQQFALAIGLLSTTNDTSTGTLPGTFPPKPYSTFARRRWTILLPPPTNCGRPHLCWHPNWTPASGLVLAQWTRSRPVKGRLPRYFFACVAHDPRAFASKQVVCNASRKFGVENVAQSFMAIDTWVHDLKRLLWHVRCARARV